MYLSLTSAKISDSMKQKCLLDIVKGKKYICSTCTSHLSQNKVPPLSKANGVKFPTQPPELNLTQLEIRVITKLPNSEQSYKGKVKTHNYINRQDQSTTGKL